MTETWHELNNRHAAERKSALEDLANAGNTISEASFILDLSNKMTVNLARNLGVKFRSKQPKEPTKNMRYLRKLSDKERRHYDRLKRYGYRVAEALQSIGRDDLIEETT